MKATSSVVLAASLSACAPKVATLQLGMAPRTGWSCGAASVGYAAVDVQPESIACAAELTFDLIPGGQTAVSMPPPGDRSGAVERRVRAPGIARRRLELSDPRPRADDWRIHVADDLVGPGKMSLSDARTWRWRDHWILVIAVHDTARSGTVFPLPVQPETRARTRYREDPTYCHEDLLVGLTVFPASDVPIVERTSWPDTMRLQDFDGFCSHTHQHVVAIDFGTTDLSAVDVVFEVANRVPRTFRFHRIERDNYTVVDVIVEPLDLE